MGPAIGRGVATTSSPVVRVLVSGKNNISTPVLESYTPKQFGPRTRIPAFFAICVTSSSSFLFPTSLNPEVIITAAFTPFLPTSFITLGTILAGTTITAKSTSSFISKIEE